MTVHRVEVARQVAPSLNEARMWPCVAGGLGVSVRCGATPASVWRISCGTPSHEEDKRLCPAHAQMCARGMVCCRACSDAGAGQRMVTAQPVDLIMLGHLGSRLLRG